MPSSTRIKVKSITYNKDKTAATVTYDYNKSYVTSLLSTGTLRVVSGTSYYTNIKNNDYWHVEDRRNALDTNSIVIRKNGAYSARIAGDPDDYFCDTHFTISGINPAPQKYSISYKLNGGQNNSKNIKLHTQKTQNSKAPNQSH